MTITIKNHGSDKGPSISGIASGVLFLVVFGALWAAIGINGLQGFDEPWVAIGILLIGLVLLIASLSLRWKTRRLPNRAAEKKEPDRQRKNKWFRIVFATELVAIVSANVICRAVNRSDLFFPVMMLIVGIHFFPLAVLFGINKYYLTGALLSLLAIGTLLVVPEQLQFSGFQITAWWVVLGLGGAFILWGTGFVHWLQGRRLLDQKKPQ